jgi:23S rRNA pseudouridine1911/1915/1917 synthase
MARKKQKSQNSQRRRGAPEWPKPQPPDRLIVPKDEETFIVQPNQEGMRLDQFLCVRIPYRSRNQLQKMIKERAVTNQDGKALGRAYRVRALEELTVPLPPPPDEAYTIDQIPLNILYEDDLLIVLNKQPNIVCHPSGGHLYDTLINALHLRYRDLEDEEKDIIPKLAHRIDRETSGILVAVKSKRHERGSPLVFEKTDIRKEYFAVAEGVIAEDAFEVDAPMCKKPGIDPNMAPMVIHPDGQTARTAFRVIERFRDFTLVRCRLYTGRQHQIRVHLQHVGHPIICDKIYGKREELWLNDVREWRADLRNRMILDRQALHSCLLSFPHPATQEQVTFEAPLTEDMAGALEQLRQGAADRRDGNG